MFIVLLDEIREALPNTQQQVDRINRAVAECGAWGFRSLSNLFQAPAVEVTTQNGVYITTDCYCSCPDWDYRISLKKGGDPNILKECKHQIGAYIMGELAHPNGPLPYEMEAEEATAGTEEDPGFPDVETVERLEELRLERVAQAKQDRALWD